LGLDDEMHHVVTSPPSRSDKIDNRLSLAKPVFLRAVCRLKTPSHFALVVTLLVVGLATMTISVSPTTGLS
jgi:hypothetical protein